MLQSLVHTGDDIDNLRNAVLECVCKHHKIQDYEQYINDGARLKYVYNTWEREDDLVVELYTCKEYEREEIGVNIRPKCVMYSHTYTLITPVTVVEKYLQVNYTLFDGIYFGVRKKS